MCEVFCWRFRPDIYSISHLRINAAPPSLPPSFRLPLPSLTYANKCHTSDPCRLISPLASVVMSQSVFCHINIRGAEGWGYNPRPLTALSVSGKPPDRRAGWDERHSFDKRRRRCFDTFLLSV